MYDFYAILSARAINLLKQISYVLRCQESGVFPLDGSQTPASYAA